MKRIKPPTKYVFAVRDGHTYAWYYTIDNTEELLESVVRTMLNPDLNFDEQDTYDLLRTIPDDMYAHVEKSKGE